MVREPILQGDHSDQPEKRPPERPLDEIDRQLNDQLRPQRLQDMIGQREIVARLEIALDAARKRGDPLGHILFDGPPGLGKTTFATVIPKELDTALQIANGASMTAPKDILPYLTNATAGSVLFIDEIHRLPTAIEEFLYPVMEDFRVDITLGEGMSARTINMQLKPFTIIGATTRSGMLSGPLRNRFQMREHVEFYENDELAEIVRRNALKLRVEITPEACEEIAGRARSTPRLANNLLRWVRDYSTSKSDGRIDLALAQAALDMQGIDDRGLDSLDRKYLSSLINVFRGGPTGIDAIAHQIETPLDTLQDEVEPFLLRLGFIIRSPRGRMVTPDGYQHLGVSPPDKNSPQQRLF